MIDEKTRQTIDQIQYIVDRFVKIDYYDIPKPIQNEPHSIGTIGDKQGIILNEIIKDEDSIKLVKKAPTVGRPLPTFVNYIVVDHSPTKAEECQLDLQNNRVLFYQSELGDSCSVNYNSCGKAMLSSALVYNEYDSNENISQTLYQLAKKCKEQLDRVVSITSAEQIKEELKSYIEAVVALTTALPDAERILEELKELCRTAPILIPELEGIVAQAEEIIEAVKSAGNKAFDILKTDWVQEGEGFIYELTHTLNSANLTIACYENTSDGFELSTNRCVILDEDRVKVYSDIDIPTKVVLSARHYEGELSPQQLNADNILDGTSKVSMTREERDLLSRVVLQSPDGGEFRLQVTNEGSLITTRIN